MHMKAVPVVEMRKTLMRAEKKMMVEKFRPVVDYCLLVGWEPLM